MYVHRSLWDYLVAYFQQFCQYDYCLISVPTNTSKPALKKYFVVRKIWIRFYKFLLTKRARFRKSSWNGIIIFLRSSIYYTGRFCTGKENLSFFFFSELYFIKIDLLRRYLFQRIHVYVDYQRPLTDYGKSGRKQFL